MAVQVPDRLDSTVSDIPTTGVEDWLFWLGTFLSDRSWSGIVEFKSDSDHGALVANFPKNTKEPAAAMLVARKVRVSGRATTVRMPKRQTAQHDQKTAAKTLMSLMAIPLPGDVNRVVLLLGAEQSSAQQKSTIALCRWAGVWLNRSGEQNGVPRAVDNAKPSLADAVLNAAYSHQTPDSVARAIVSAVKRLCGCVRVSLAIQQYPQQETGKLSLIAMSDQASIDARKVLPTQIIATMQEALDARRLQASEAEQGVVQPESFSAESVLFREQGEHPALAVMYPPDKHAVEHMAAPLTQVALLLERPVDQVFSDAQSLAIQSALEPSLDLLVRLFDNQLPPLKRMAQQWRRKTDHQYLVQLSLRHRWRLITAALLISSVLITVPHKISAHATIEAKDLQVLIAPQDGFVSTSHVRAGDFVKKNQLLATLDTQDLNLDADKWRSEFAKNEQAASQALATKDRVAIGRIRADAVRISAELELVERQIARSELRAPFDGVVLAGDLHQQLGAVVTRGETLFTVAASDEYRLVLELEEHDVGLVHTGQSAKVRLSALPNMSWDASIDAVLPVAMTTAEKHIFRVPANFSAQSKELLPGMEGIARLNAGSRSLAWVYTRSLREKARLLLWRIGVIR